MFVGPRLNNGLGTTVEEEQSEGCGLRSWGRDNLGTEVEGQWSQGSGWGTEVRGNGLEPGRRVAGPLSQDNSLGSEDAI